MNKVELNDMYALYSLGFVQCSKKVDQLDYENDNYTNKVKIISAMTEKQKYLLIWMSTC